MPHIRKGDLVIVIAGANKGKKGKVLRVGGGRVVIEKVAMVKRHMKPSATNPEGGIVSFEAPIPSSNLMLLDPATGEPTRIRAQVAADGSKERIAVKSGRAFPRV